MTPDRMQVKRLTRMFFGRLFESDMMPPGLPQVQLVVWVGAFLAAPSLLWPVLMSKKYFWLRPGDLDRAIASDRTTALLFSLIATGLITLVIWEGIFPDRRDGRILGVLPIRLRALVVARLGALALVFLMFVCATALPAALSFGGTSDAYLASASFAATAGAHFLATAGAEAVVFFGVVLLQCIVLNTVGAAVAQRLAVVLQLVLVVGLFQMPMILPLLASPRLAAAAPIAALGTSASALLLYAASYRRLTRLALEGTGQSNSENPRLRRLVTLLARMLPLTQAGRGVFAFTIRTVARNRQHRMLLAGWVGLALALVVSSLGGALARNGWGVLSAPNPVVLAAPLILAALTMTGLRMLFAIPAEIHANWSIRSRQPVPVRHAIDGATAALVVCGVLPAVAVAFATATALWGARVGMMHAVYCGILGVLLAEILSIGLDKVPFTCTYMPGKGRIVKLWPLYLTIFSFYTGGMASLETQLLRRGGFLMTIVAFAALTAVTATVRRHRASELPHLRFEEEPLDALTLISL